MKFVLGRERDPLLVLLLAAIGAELGGCGGRSTRHTASEDAADAGTPGTAQSAGTAGTGMLGAGTGGLGGAFPSQNEPPAPPPPDAPLTTEGVLGCDSPSLYPLPPPSSTGPADTGFSACNGGFIHRRLALDCPEPTGTACDLDCNETATSRCLPSPLTCVPPKCVSACRSDADCAADQLCLCDSNVNHCVPASCRSDADCGDGLLCIGLAINGRFDCQTSSDECTTACPSYAASVDNQPVRVWGNCYLAAESDGSQHRTCSYSTTNVSCGRPFLVAEGPRLAELAERSDWASAVPRALRVDDLPAAVRRELARSYGEMALMEHASIAAFARFSLQLLALGAPAELVRDAALAGLDEQRHAELCFGLASAYAGEAVGPGAIDVHGCLGDVSLASVALTTFLEGCVGETVAAVEARELARATRDPVLAAALARIAEDESRHAALAWRFLRWALERLGPSLEVTLVQALETARAEAAVEPSSVLADSELAQGYGLLGSAQRAQLRRLTLENIVSPCLAALVLGAGVPRRSSHDPYTPSVSVRPSALAARRARARRAAPC